MPKKPGEYGLLGLTPDTQHMLERLPDSNWDKFKATAAQVKDTIHEKFNSIKESVRNWTDNRLILLNLNSPEQKPAPPVENEQKPVGTENEARVVDTETAANEQPAEVATAATQKEVETIEEQVTETTTENATETDEAEKKVAAITERAENALQQLETQLDGATQQREALDQRIAKLEALVLRIEAILQTMNEQQQGSERGDNVVDISEYSKNKAEGGQEKRELTGDGAVAESLERYGADYIEHDEGRKWLIEKFDDEKSNPADVVIALGVLEQFQEERGLDGKRPDPVVAEAISHLQDRRTEKENWKQPEGQVSDWMEAQANLNGRDEEKNRVVLQLRGINSESDPSQIATAREAIRGMRKDRVFRSTISLDAAASMNDSLKEAELKLDDKEASATNQVNPSRAA